MYASITGKVISDLKIINLVNGVPFTRFTLEDSHGKSYNCLVSKKQSLNFNFDVTKNTIVTIDARINERMQLIVDEYFVHQRPTELVLGRVFNYRGMESKRATF